MIAAGGARLLLTALHRKRAHGDDRYRREIRIDFNSTGRLVPIDDWHLNVHEDEDAAAHNDYATRLIKKDFWEHTE